jgi:hypothetical protein
MNGSDGLNRLNVVLYKWPVPVRLFEIESCRIYDLRHDDNKSWTADGSRLSKMEDFNPYEQSKRFITALKLLKENLPIFARHFEDLASIELKIRHFATQAVDISNFFSNKKISYILIPSGASHHVGTLVCEVAAYLSATHIVNLYPLEYSSHYPFEVIPLVSSGSLETRQVFPLPFNTKDSSQISIFLSTDPKNEYEVSWRNQKETIYKFDRVVLASILQWMKIVLSRVLKKPIYRPYGSDRLIPYSTKTFFRLLLVQRNALELLDEFINQDSDKVADLIKDPSFSRAILIMAHAEPEMTVFPEGGKWYNFIDIVSNVRKSGWSGVILYKEHPQNLTYSVQGRISRTGSARDSEYYQTLRNLGCLFVEHSFDYLDCQNILPLTITGSIALERASKNLPTIVVGNPWYKQAGCFLSLEEFMSEEAEYTLMKEYRTLLDDFIKREIKGKVISSYKNLRNSSMEILKSAEFVESMKSFLASLIRHHDLQSAKKNDS